MCLSMEFFKLLTCIQSQLRAADWRSAWGFQYLKTPCDLSSNFWTVNKASVDLRALRHHLCQTHLAPLVLHRKWLHRREGAGELLQGARDCEARDRNRHGERGKLLNTCIVTLKQCELFSQLVRIWVSGFIFRYIFFNRKCYIYGPLVKVIGRRCTQCVWKGKQMRYIVSDCLVFVINILRSRAS